MRNLPSCSHREASEVRKESSFDHDGQTRSLTSHKLLQFALVTCLISLASSQVVIATSRVTTLWCGLDTRVADACYGLLRLEKERLYRGSHSLRLRKKRTSIKSFHAALRDVQGRIQEIDRMAI
jgi:hypothetical protein